MYAYTNSDLRFFVMDSLRRRTKPSAREVTWHLSTVARIAQMMRKFEKEGSENYKKSLEYVFDKQHAVSQLKREAADVKLAMNTKLLHLVYFIRKFDIDWPEMMTEINKNFVAVALDALKFGETETESAYQTVYYYSLALKYLCRNTNSVNQLLPIDIIRSLKTAVDSAVKTELVWILGYILSSINRSASVPHDVINAEMNNDINTFVMNNSEISDESKTFLLSEINAVKRSTADDVGQTDFEHQKSGTLIKRQKEGKTKNQLVVSKTTQVVKSNVKDQKCDDVQLRVLNLANALKNRQRMVITNSTRQPLVTNDDAAGSDQSIWSTTWGECINLYSLSTLKKKDKDDYLPEKFFGSHTFKAHPNSRLLYKLFINRMIANIFRRISSKQRLGEGAITGLMKCITDARVIGVQIFDEWAHSGYRALTTPLSELFGYQVHDKYARFCEDVVGGICEDYKIIEGLNGPDLLKSFYKKIVDKVTYKKTERGWFNRTYEIRVFNQSYNKWEAHGLIKKELEELRMDAVTALYNCACRDRRAVSNSHMKAIQQYLTVKKGQMDDEDEESFQGILFDIIDAVNESDSGLDYKVLFSTHMNVLMASSSTSASQRAVNFMIRETRDARRCQEFISDDVVGKLIQLLERDAQWDRIKVCVTEIINNYLEQEFCRTGLSERHLLDLVLFITNRKDLDQKITDGLLVSILLTVEKCRCLPAEIVKILVNSLDGTFGDFILLLLSRCEKNFISESRQLELVSGKLLSENAVIEQENSMPKIGKLTNSNNSSSCTIALLAAQMLLKSLERFRSEISKKTLLNLLSVLESGSDKDAQLVSIKCIYLLSIEPKSYAKPFCLDSLRRLQSFVTNEVTLIRTYAHAAYVYSLSAFVSTTSEPLNGDLMDSLSSMYVCLGSMRIGEKDFVPEINEKVLQILECEAGKGHSFEDENLFLIMDEILYENKSTEFSLKVLLILEKYTSPRKDSTRKLPKTTILVLEHALTLTDLAKDALFCLQNVISNGQRVSGEILQQFVDNLQVSDNSRRRLKAFKMLDKARINQDISDDAFVQLELVRAAYGLSLGRDFVHEDRLIQYIKIKSQKGGLQMPKDVMLVLEKYLHDKVTLDILCNVAKNHQILQYNMLEKLAATFGSSNAGEAEKNSQLIDIFEYVARNNQTLSKTLLDKLEFVLGSRNEMLEMKVLLIFAHRVQKGGNLTANVIKNILMRLECHKKGNVAFYHELLNSIGSIVLQCTEGELITYTGKIQKILLEGLMSDNVYTQKLSVTNFAALMRSSQIDTNYLSKLVEVCTDVHLWGKCDLSVKDNLLSILLDNLNKQNGFTDRARSKLELAQLAKLNSDEEYLDQLERVVKTRNGSTELLHQNYIQLANILNIQHKDSHLRKRKALTLLASCKLRPEVCEELKDSLAILYESTSSQDIKQSCLEILKALSKIGDTTPRISKILSRAGANESTTLYITRFLKSPAPLLAIFKKQLKLTNENIAEILGAMNVADSQSLFEVKNLDELFETWLRDKSTNGGKFCESLVMVNFIERVLMDTKGDVISRKALQCYGLIIKQGSFQNLTAVSQNIINVFGRNMDLEFQTALIECIFLLIPRLAQRNKELTMQCLRVLELCLEHEHRLIRVQAFAGLAFAATQFSIHSHFFDLWCYSKLEELSALTQLKLHEHQCFDILYVIVSLKHIDLDVFKTTKSDEIWLRELLISNIFQELEPISDTEKLEFYDLWFQIEERHAAHFNGQVFLFHLNLQISLFESAKLVNELLFILAQCNTIPQIAHLSMHDFTILFQQGFKQTWCMELIDRCLENKQEFDRVYISQLAETMCQHFQADVILKLMKSIGCIDDLLAFESLLQYCSSKGMSRWLESIVLTNVSCPSVSELQCLLQVEYLCYCLSPTFGNKDEMNNLRNLLLDMLRQQSATENCWKYEQLSEMIDVIKKYQISKRLVERVVNLFQIISFYKLSPVKFRECLEILREPDALANLNKLAVENKFSQKGSMKNSAELLLELENINRNQTTPQKTNCTIKLAQQLKEIKSETLKSDVMSSYEQPICQWEKKHIRQWANNIQQSAALNTIAAVSRTAATNIIQWVNNKITLTGSRNLDIVEAIAVVKRANFLHTGYHLTDTQILASLISLGNQAECTNSERGKLLQVATGEGKSTIVCILAIVNALRDGAAGGSMQVDVITSSPVLAERDVVHKARLYKMFNLTCSSNNDSVLYVKGPKDCYNANIVYGEVSQFQFDRLRDEYSQLGTLSERKCSQCIVDEVDAMLIDDSCKIARLSSTAAGMDHFHSVYVFLWHKLTEIRRRFIMFDSSMYLLNGKVEFENGTISMECADEQGEMFKIPDLEQYIKEQGTNLSPSIGELIEGSIDEYLEKTLNEYIDFLIAKKVVNTPSNFEEFFKKQRGRWISNAIEAMNYQENVQYLVHDGQIKPVDYSSTGIVQNCTNWSDGLHQFLQLKHNLKITSETFTTNFLSNIAFINAYKKVFGLTGTLGSRKARAVLESVYKVQLINIPPLRQKQYVEFPARISVNETKWIEDICAAALLEAQKQRGVLIICETIQHANVLKDRLMVLYRTSAIKLYTMNNMNQEKQIDNMLRGDIVIATNLAGRGTDIRTEAIEEFGGLHVIVTFMPQNQRVQEQAFGRTARQGKLGTGQMILNMQQLGADYANTDQKEVTIRRDEVEAMQLDSFQNNDLKLIQAKDELFAKFCTFINKNIRDDLRSKDGRWRRFKKRFVDVPPTAYEIGMISAIEEQWAMFLRKLDDKSLTIEESMAQFDSLRNDLMASYQRETVIKNLYYHVVIGNDFMVNVGDFKKAKRHFEMAVKPEKVGEKTEQQFYGAAHVGLAWSSIKSDDIKTSKPKHAILESFKRGLDILSTEMGLLNSMQSILLQTSLQSGGNFSQSSLDIQMNVRSTILGSYMNSVQQCMNVIQRSLRLIDIMCLNNTEGVTELFSDIDREHNLDTVQWVHAETLNDVSYQLTFNNLTVHKDSGDRDQAVKTIDNAFTKRRIVSSSHLADSYKGLELKLNQINLSRLRALFSEDKEFEGELSAQSVISLLRKERTYLNAMHITDSYDVDMRILHSNGHEDRKLNIQINDALGIVESNLSSDKLRYSFRIKQANINNVNKHYWSNVRDGYLKSSFKIAFDALDNSTAKKFADLCNANGATAEVDLMAKKCDLLALLEKTNKKGLRKLLKDESIFRFSVCTEERKKYKKVNKEQLMGILKKLQSDQKFIAFKVNVASLSKVDEFLSLFPESLFNIAFIGVSFPNTWKLLSLREELERNAASFSFQSLDRFTAKLFIPCLRSEQLEFCLVFAGISKKNEALHIITAADLGQEAIEINKVRPLLELFLKNSIPYAELNEFAAKGIEYLLEISEKRFIPWYSICAVAALGCLQIVVGTAFMMTGFGSTVGMSLIAEGLSDIFYAYRAYSTRQFDWGDYAKQKAVSVIISVCSAGYSKLKDAGKGATSVLSGEAGNLAREATKEVAEATAAQFATNIKTVGSVMVKSGQNLKVLAFKYVGVKAGEAAVREGITSGFQHLTNLSLDLIRPYVQADIEHRVRAKFSNQVLGGLLRKAYVMDSISNCRTLQDRVNRIISDAINPERSFMMTQWNTVGMPLLKGILGTSEKYGSAISMGFRVAGTLHGLYAIQAIIDNVHEETLKKITQIDQDTMTTKLVLERYVEIKSEEARAISCQLEIHKIDLHSIINLGILNVSANKANELRNKIYLYKKENKSVGLFLENFLEKFLTMENSFQQSFSVILKSVSDRISDQIMRVIDSQLVAPWTSLAASGLTDALSVRLQHYCVVNKKHNTDELNNDKERYNDLTKKQKNGEKLSDDDKTFLKSFGKYRTIGQQVNYNAQAYCIDYQQYSIKHFTDHGSEVKQVNEAVERLAESITSDKPATMVEMNILAKKIGLKLKVTSDENYVPTPEETARGIKVIYVMKGQKDEKGVDKIGHASIVNPDGTWTHIPSESNNCFYVACSELLKEQGVQKSPEQLRQITADAVRANGNILKVMKAEKWIRDRHPAEANTLLFSAGVIKYDKNSKRLTVDDIDVTDLKASAGNKNERRGGDYEDRFKSMIKEGNIDEEGKIIEETDKIEKTHSQFTRIERDSTGQPTKEQVVSGKGNVHLHHVVSYDKIKDMLIKLKTCTPEELAKSKKEVEDYINLPHVQPYVIHTINNRRQGVKDGVLLHAAFTWNKHNVVPGPAPENRGGAGSKSTVDTQISNKQSADFQNKLNTFVAKNTIQAYSEIPQAQGVKWFEQVPTKPTKPNKPKKYEP